MANDSKSGGIGFGSLLLLSFIILKLTHVIDWSWWWVFAPVWAPIAILLAFFGIIVLIKIIIS